MLNSPPAEVADFGPKSATGNTTASTRVQRATVNRTALAWHKKRRLTGPSGKRATRCWFWNLQLVRHLQPEVRTCLPVSRSKGLRSVQRVLVRALRRQRRDDAADTRPQSRRPRRSRRRARGRISTPFLPAQSSSSQAPLPTRTEVHATHGRVYSLDSTSSPTWTASCASRHASQITTRIPR